MKLKIVEAEATKLDPKSKYIIRINDFDPTSIKRIREWLIQNKIDNLIIIADKDNFQIVKARGE